MSEAASRSDVVASARAWIGTPYHNCADVRGVGVDCAMLLVRVFVDLGLVAPFDPRPYAPDWHLHRGEERYLGLLLARAHAVATALPGDVILFRYGRCYSHGGIVARADPLTIIHAFHPAGIVLEEEIARNCELNERLGDARFASYWEPSS
jgi:NlpC/P60 family putative phage cell wall peptidase